MSASSGPIKPKRYSHASVARTDAERGRRPVEQEDAPRAGDWDAPPSAAGDEAHDDWNSAKWAATQCSWGAWLCIQKMGLVFSVNKAPHGSGAFFKAKVEAYKKEKFDTNFGKIVGGQSNADEMGGELWKTYPEGTAETDMAVFTGGGRPDWIT